MFQKRVSNNSKKNMHLRYSQHRHHLEDSVGSRTKYFQDDIECKIDSIDYTFVMWFLMKKWNIFNKLVSDTMFNKGKDAILNTVSQVQNFEDDDDEDYSTQTGRNNLVKQESKTVYCQNLL